MIIESKESKTNASLIDLLGGNAKTADSKKDGIFSKLLSSLGAQTKTGDKTGTLPADFKALIDPKNGVVRSLDSQKGVDKNAGIGQLQALLRGSEESEPHPSGERVPQKRDCRQKPRLRKSARSTSEKSDRSDPDGPENGA
ncbi:hypothetical protein [Sulfuricurvum sp. MLSB]|uniref:hypothetical protein n=1 Tax=Sulfuricurvum sp. MLSB TaxID=1537917 RepID=UPI000AF7E675|nr:hypothetical protein [Sulfuricurvum sp. MLSB]